jgi:hypothetical protein
MLRENVSDTYGGFALLAAAPVRARWDDSPTVPLAVAPCLTSLGRFSHLPIPEAV